MFIYKNKCNYYKCKCELQWFGKGKFKSNISKIERVLCRISFLIMNKGTVKYFNEARFFLSPN